MAHSVYCFSCTRKIIVLPVPRSSEGLLKAEGMEESRLEKLKHSGTDRSLQRGVPIHCTAWLVLMKSCSFLFSVVFARKVTAPRKEKRIATESDAILKDSMIERSSSVKSLKTSNSTSANLLSKPLHDELDEDGMRIDNNQEETAANSPVINSFFVKMSGVDNRNKDHQHLDGSDGLRPVDSGRVRGLPSTAVLQSLGLRGNLIVQVDSHSSAPLEHMQSLFTERCQTAHQLKTTSIGLQWSSRRRRCLPAATEMNEPTFAPLRDIIQAELEHWKTSFQQIAATWLEEEVTAHTANDFILCFPPSVNRHYLAGFLLYFHYEDSNASDDAGEREREGERKEEGETRVRRDQEDAWSVTIGCDDATGAMTQLLQSRWKVTVPCVGKANCQKLVASLLDSVAQQKLPSTLSCVPILCTEQLMPGCASEKVQWQMLRKLTTANSQALSAFSINSDSVTSSTSSSKSDQLLVPLPLFPAQLRFLLRILSEQDNSLIVNSSEFKLSCFPFAQARNSSTYSARTLHCFHQNGEWSYKIE